MVMAHSAFVLLCVLMVSVSCFFFNDTATTEIYTLSLHDALPIFETLVAEAAEWPPGVDGLVFLPYLAGEVGQKHETVRSEEHTSELQSQSNLVCRLLLEKKKKQQHQPRTAHQL